MRTEEYFGLFKALRKWDTQSRARAGNTHLLSVSCINQTSSTSHRRFRRIGVMLLNLMLAERGRDTIRGEVGSEADHSGELSCGDHGLPGGGTTSEAKVATFARRPGIGW